MMYQPLSLTEIFQAVWEGSKVTEENVKSFYRMDIIWGRLRDALQLLSDIALTVLNFQYGKAEEERGIFIILKTKQYFVQTISENLSIQ